MSTARGACERRRTAAGVGSGTGAARRGCHCGGARVTAPARRRLRPSSAATWRPSVDRQPSAGGARDPRTMDGRRRADLRARRVGGTRPAGAPAGPSFAGCRPVFTRGTRRNVAPRCRPRRHVPRPRQVARHKTRPEREKYVILSGQRAGEIKPGDEEQIYNVRQEMTFVPGEFRHWKNNGLEQTHRSGKFNNTISS